MTLKDYMKQVEQIYKKYAPDFIKEANAEKALREEIYNIRGSRELTPEGKQARIEPLQRQCEKHRAKMELLAKTAQAKALEVRSVVESRFYDRYHANPDAMDMRGVELLRSGILSDKEIKQLAEQYSDNCTMQRICGKYMEQSADQETRTLGRVLQANASDPHLRCIDSIIEVGSYCMGGAHLSGANGAERMLSRFDEMTAQTYAAAPDISD